MKMEKDHFNDKVLDKEKALSVIKTSYLNSYKVIVAGARDFANYAYMKKKQKTFLDESDMDVEGFWNKIASYNFIQEPMKGTHEVPSLADYETAWKCLADVVQIIKPDVCIFVDNLKSWR
jgi:hypothetical protein